MKLYTETEQYKLYEGSMLDMLDVIEENSIDSIVTDPPYELGFMGKSWDKSGIAFQKETWEKCLRVLKPGGYLLSFGGSRTFHRIACAIEDAGFEIRDTIMWLVGSGFPKSMNIGKAVEAKLTTGSANTQEFKNLDGEKSVAGGWGINKRQFDQGCRSSNYDDSCEAYTTKVNYTTEEGKHWDGWGTALKPAFESVTIARKPCDSELFTDILHILEVIIKRCPYKLNAKLVEKFSMLSQAVTNVDVNIAQNLVNKNNSWVDLFEVMAMLRLELMENMNSNIEWLCVKYLEEICYHQSKFTIEMKLNLITDLRTLKLLLVQNISQNIMHSKEMNQHGTMQSVLTVEKFLEDAMRRLIYINMNSVQEDVTLKVNESKLRPNVEPVIVARKPCEGSTTDNVLKYGVGGINIDECRIQTDDTLIHGGPLRTNSGDDRIGKSLGMFQDGTENTFVQNPNGRFPANVILTYDDSDFNEVCGGMPYTKSTGGSGEASKKSTLGNYDGGWERDHTCANLGGLGDEGSAARYFYCAKASKLDRDEGLDAFVEHSTGELQGGRKDGSAGSVMNPLRPDGHIRNNPLNPYAGAGGIKKNNHPCVKPTSLMQYLVRLVSPKGSTILDPFNGSGSTGKAVMFENRSRNADYKYIGIDLSEEYLAISKARIDYAMVVDMQVDQDGKIATPKKSDSANSKLSQYSLFDNI